MTGKTLKISFMILTVILLLIITLVFRNRVFVPINKIYNPRRLEFTKDEKMVSCQIDCSLNDFKFHEECIGYNGCENSSYIKNSNYCEKDSDCVLDESCCFNSCDDCVDLDYCPVSNKYYFKAHSFSCNNTIFCNEVISCRNFSVVKCVSNSCRIIR